MNESDPRYDWMRQYAEGTASAETTAQLERALQEDAALRKLFLEYLNVDLALSIGAADSELEPVAKLGRLPRVTWRAFVIGTTAAAALLLLTAVVAIWWSRDRLGNRAAPVTEAIYSATRVIDPYLAIIVDESPDARWLGKDAPGGLGHALGRERCLLQSGEATLQLDNGVELMLRAPAELQLHSVDHGELYRGQLSARVPKKAIGFRVDAPGVNVVDLGTEFSLAVDGSGQPKVHVFTGKVRAALPSLPDSRTELTAGQSARFDVHGPARRSGSLSAANDRQRRATVPLSLAQAGLLPGGRPGWKEDRLPTGAFGHAGQGAGIRLRQIRIHTGRPRSILEKPG